MEQQEVAVVVTDMRMPTMSGEELLRIIKERWPQTIRMVVTAYSDIDPILRAINEGLVGPLHHQAVDPRRARASPAVGDRGMGVGTRLRRGAPPGCSRPSGSRPLGSISGHMVHDLKQPLMSLVVNAELLKEIADSAPLLRKALEHVPQPDRSRINELITELDQVSEDVKTSVEHLNKLVTSMRGFSSPHRPDPTSLATDPLPILRHAMSVCQELVVKARAQIDYNGLRELPRVTGCPRPSSRRS